MSKFLDLVKKQLGDDGYFGTPSIKSWSSGIYALDRALGGGFPSARISLVVGKESTFKSTIAAKLAGVVSHTNFETGKIMNPGSEGGCKVLYVDQEGTIDEDWCAKHNYFPQDNGNIVMATTTGNQAIDVINAALQSREFSLIVLDSIEALIPAKDLEKSSEDFVMGTKAKMNNDAFRRWTVSLQDAAHNIEKWWQRPTLLCVNQLRDAIGGMGPVPPVIPGGIGQKQAASIIIQMNTPKYSDDGKLASIATVKGVVKKNKTYTPRAAIEFDMAVRDLPEKGLTMGQVDNITSVLKDVRANNLWEKKEDGLWHLFEYSVRTQAEFNGMMQADPEVEQNITRQVIKALQK